MRAIISNRVILKNSSICFNIIFNLFLNMCFEKQCYQRNLIIEYAIGKHIARFSSDSQEFQSDFKYSHQWYYNIIIYNNINYKNIIICIVSNNCAVLSILEMQTLNLNFLLYYTFIIQVFISDA